MNKQDLALLALAFAEDKALTPVQVQKTIFLFQKAIEEGHWTNLLREPYEFIAYDYGPFCKEIYWDIACLSTDGFANVKGSPSARYSTYSSTESGKVKAKNVLNEVPQPLAEYLAQLAAWVRMQNFRSLVSAVYNRYPEMAKNSVFKR